MTPTLRSPVDTDPPVAVSELLATVRRYAANPNLTALLTDDEGQTRARLAGDARLDVWLATWPQGSSSGWHDHGPAAGALAVVTGAVVEETWEHGAVRRRPLTPGPAHRHPAGQVHQLRSSDQGRTLTVHAYAPGLVSMNRADRADRADRSDRSERRRYELTVVGPVVSLPIAGGVR